MRLLAAASLALAACLPAIDTPRPSPTDAVTATERSIASVSPSPSAVSSAGRAIPFTLVDTSPRARSTRPSVVVATTAEEAASLLSNERVATHVALLPPLEAGTAYLAAFAGPRPYAGYAVRIVDLRDTTGALVVWTRETPPAGDTFLPLVSYPVSVAAITASQLPDGRAIEQRDAASGALLSRVVYCGSTRQTSPLTPYDPTRPECVWSAYGRGDSAQWLRRSLTTEGGPIIRTLRAVPGGVSEVSVDDRGDGFAHRPGVHTFACAQVARSSADGEDGRTRVWFELSLCTGDGPLAYMG